LATPERTGTLLAFDYGEKRIGVAVGDTSVGIAHPLATVEQERREARYTAIGELVREWRPVALVVGLPTHADGSAHERTAAARRFANRLAGRFGLPVELVDERFTTLEAGAALAGAGVPGRAAQPVRDQVAAQIILQSFLDSHAARSREDSR